MSWRHRSLDSRSGHKTIFTSTSRPPGLDCGAAAAISALEFSKTISKEARKSATGETGLTNESATKVPSLEAKNANKACKSKSGPGTRFSAQE